VTEDQTLFGDLHRPVVGDLFCGGGGASHGLTRAGLPPTFAINHNAAAIEMHAANHPDTRHAQEDVWTVRPTWGTRGRRLDFLWLSPQCTHFSRARGGVPCSKQERTQGWIVLKWAAIARPRCIIVENVPEFLTWGPLGRSRRPIKAKKGSTFRRWVQQLQGLGYTVEWRVLRACDYGAPTSRERVYIIARLDGAPVWPAPTHGPGRPKPYRTAAECIDWDIPCPSIFLTKEEVKAQKLHCKRPLAEATMRRIAAGIKRFVLDAKEPFLLQLSHGGRLVPLGRPMPTVTGLPAGGDLTLIRPVVAPALIAIGERHGRGESDAGAPMPTVMPTQRRAVVAAFLAKHFGGPNGQQTPGGEMRDPMPSVTGTGQMGPVAVFLDKLHGSALAGQAIDQPAPTITGGGGRGGGHAAIVAAFLAHYYGEGGQAQSPGEPIHTIVTKARHALVTVTIDGEPYVIVDIGMRMLTPRELLRAQGLPDSYILSGTIAEQIERIGNMVCPDVAEALARANRAAP
jgi:DNA (cytosine-5)-methyltransferase 1